MIIETTILEQQAIWVERTIRFEADSVKHAEEILARQTMESLDEIDIEYGDGDYISDETSITAIECIHYNQKFEEI